MNDLANTRVCFLAGTLGQGGAERQLFFILRALRQNGAHPRVMCLGRNETWEAPINALDVPVTWVGQSKLRIGRLLKIVRELRKHLPAIIQSQHFYTNAYAIAAARILGLRAIGAMQNDGISEVHDSGRFGGWVNLRGPRLMTINSEAGIRYALGQGIPRQGVYPMPNVVDTEQFTPAPRSSNGSIRLLTVGRLCPQKRMDRFLSVVARLRRQKGPKINATIAGAGPLRDALEKRAAELGISDAVEFAGGVSDVERLYRQADIFALTSDYEGLPNVLLEAMASGLPVVATSVGGVPPIVHDGETGFLVPPADEEAMASAILLLANKPELRRDMGRRGRAFVEHDHSLARLPVLLQGLYERANNGSY
jgi:glycosyltransferase involved in cell wall biosynthesis